MSGSDSTPAPLAAYLSAVAADHARGIATEHTYRPALKELVEALDKDLIATNKPSRIECGAPDFIITRRDLPVGYIEAKDIGISLDDAERTDQLGRYRKSLGNLILTDYLEFRWYRDGECVEAARLAHVLSNGKLQVDRSGVVKVASLFASFFAAEPPRVSKPQELAGRMAGLAGTIRDAVTAALRQEDVDGESALRDQLRGFREVLLHDLTGEEFADMYAQTIAYGLFAARVNAPDDSDFSRRHAAYDLPKTNPFLRQMFGHIAGPDLDDRISWAVDDLAELLNRAQMEVVLRDFGKRTRKADPVVHFYETFLAAYDPRMREARGVYFTPEPVVSYIVRSVDHILKTDFGLEDGLADRTTINVRTTDGKGTRTVHKVQILDPACGTGTFLAQVIETIYDSFITNRGMWPGYVHEHLLPRLFGFELLMAPYAIAHLKLGMRLRETGYDVDSSERLRVYLTNSLEEAHDLQHGQLNLFSSWLAQEADRASEVKRDLPVMVVLGNPPYSGQSANKGRWISDLLHGREPGSKTTQSDYFSVDGHPLGENNPKWLYDDYVKFIRFAQWRVVKSGGGVVAFITNHGFLDNPTFRGMRQSLMGAFDDIFLLDLHGNVRKKERCPDGTRDENVFDIPVGVAISIFIRRGAKASRECAVHHCDLWGMREHLAAVDGEQTEVGKYPWLMENRVDTTEWQTLDPKSPSYLFVPQDTARQPEYEDGWSITDIMPVNSNGLITSRDKFVFGFSKEEVAARIRDFRESPLDVVKARYRLRDVREMKLSESKRLVEAMQHPESLIRPCLYRPFDYRMLFYDKSLVRWTTPQVMKHLLGGDNLALITSRMTKGETFHHVQASRTIAEVICLSSKTSNNAFVFPLYLETNEGRGVNLHPDFIGEQSSRLAMTYQAESGRGDLASNFGPEDVAHYIYAVLHSPTYRARYSEFLKRDFPRVPFCSNQNLFRTLCELGRRLVSVHLFEAEAAPRLPSYPVAGDNRVATVSYSSPAANGDTGRVWINGEQYFEGVAPEVWEFHVGGYQVCEKWLRSRKGRPLTFDELTQYRRMIAAVAETITAMSAIDEAVELNGGWPIT